MAESTDAMKQTPPWTVRPYRAGDEAQVTALFEATFGRPQTVEQYRWKILDAPWPVAAPTAWLGEAAGQIIGQYAATPMRFKLGEATLPVLHGCDVMTAADFRGQGVLTRVGEAATESWRDAGVAFVTALQYGGWGTRREHLGWRVLFPAIWLWHPLRPEILLLRRIRSVHPRLIRPLAFAALVWSSVGDWLSARPTAGVKVAPVAWPGPEFDTLWEALRGRYEALVVRDRAWVGYRYADAPDYNYHLLLAWRRSKPVGYIAYRVTGGFTQATGWIMDLFTAPDDVAARAALLHAARLAMYKAKVGTVRVLLAARTPLVSFFQRAGFVRGRGQYDVSLVPLASDQPHPALQDPNRWFTMAGDYDVL